METLLNQKNDIQNVLIKMMQAWNERDAKAFALLFTENGIHTNVFGQRNQGHAAIEKQHAFIFSTLFKDSYLEIMEGETEFIQPGIAATDAKWTMAGAAFPDGTEWPERKGLLSLILLQENGQWKIHSFHNMELNSMPPQVSKFLHNKN